MKKISVAILVSLSALSGIASAQSSYNGIVTTHDANLAAQIEQHARNVEAQPAVVEQDEKAAVGGTEAKPAHHHHNHKKTVAKSKQHHATVASK